MPTYDYLCEACGHEFELFQSMTARVKRTCPVCSKPKLKRLVGTGEAIIFKGSGFYETDYRSDSYKKAAEADKKPASAGEKKAETKKDGAAKKTKKDGAGKTEKPKPSGSSAE